MPANTGQGEGADEAPRTAQERFTALLLQHRVRLLSFVLSLAPNWADAEDIVQQTSVVLWRKFGEFEPGTNFLAWGCQIARFQVMNHIRKQGRDPHVFSDDLIDLLTREGIADANHLERESVALQSCMEKLPPASRELLGRCYDSGSAIKEVSEQLGRTANSVYKEVNRIREALLRCIRKTIAQEGI